MNKLVSKNPILRFKLGSRIEKLQKGRYVQAGTSTFGTKIWVDTLTGHLYKTGLDPNVEKMNLTPLNSLGTSTSVYSGLNGRITINGRDYIRKNNSNNRTQVSTGTNVSKTTGNGLRAVEMNTSLELAQKANLEKMMAEETARKKASSTRKPAVRRPVVRRPTVVTKPTVVANRAATGYTLPEGVTSVADTQTMLKNAGFNLGKYGVDGVWGKDTLAAYNAWKNSLNSKVNPTAVSEVNKEFINIPLTASITSPNAIIPNTITAPQITYDRAGIRQLIRDRGFNPYLFSGAQRRALRMVLNGQGTDTDRTIVSGMGIFKNGGLISRNPVNRFKSNFR